LRRRSSDYRRQRLPFSLVYRKDGVSQIDQLRAMGRRAKAPWKDEEDALAQLSKDVAELQKHRSHDDGGIIPRPPNSLSAATLRLQ